MHHIPEYLFIAVALWVIYAAIRYSGPARIEVLGIYASDGTRLDRPSPALSPVRVRSAQAISIRASGDAHVTFSESGITVRGPGRVTIRG